MTILQDANEKQTSPSGPTFVLRYSNGEQSKVYCGHGALQSLGVLLAEQAPRPYRVVVCSDDQVFDLHGERLLRSLQAAGLAAVSVVMPAGEDRKNLTTVAACFGEFAGHGVERSDVVVALGGGVPGDLFGFVAATYLRGLRLVQVPTTLVAQVDSSLGGKVGVDLPEGKNLVGAFKHAEYVIADHDLLGTLPVAEWVAGTAEVVKHGVIADADLFSLLESDPSGWRERTVPLAPVLAMAIAVKARIVQQDEREAGLRMALNYGHTFGHALEAAADYRGIRHGEAVAWGMVMEARLAERRSLTTRELVLRQDHLLQALGLLRPLPSLTEQRVYERLFLDKKVRAGKLRWALPGPEPGSVMIRDDVPLDVVREVLAATLAGSILQG